MAELKEMTIHNWLKKEIKKRFGSMQIHIKSPPGMYSSRRGISDFVYCIRGKYVAIEVKRAPGMVPSLIQQNFLDDVNAAGGIGLCCAGKDPHIIDLLDDLTSVSST